MRRMKNIIQNYLISVILRLDRRIHVLSLWIARSSRAMTLFSAGLFIAFSLLAGCATLSPLQQAASEGNINTKAQIWKPRCYGVRKLMRSGLNLAINILGKGAVSLNTVWHY